MRLKLEKNILRGVLFFTIGSLPITLFRNKQAKDWLLLYFMDALSNVTIDNFLTERKMLCYPVRLFPKVFRTNFLFDYLFYPLVTIVFNQITQKDKAFSIFYKVFYFTIPMIIIEYLLNKFTDLVKWQKGWHWYHTFISLSIKFIITRYLMDFIRKLSNIDDTKKGQFR